MLCLMNDLAQASPASFPTPGSAPALPPFSAKTTASGTLYIVINAGSGHRNSDDEQQIMSRVFSTAGRSFEFLLIRKSRQISALACRAVELALANQGVVVAAGGDGTINAVAGAVMDSAMRGAVCPFGVIPQGTFNYFGRAHGISQDTNAAAQALVNARAEPVQVGLVNGAVFLVNASVGLYPQLLEDREVWKLRLGRSRVVAFFSGMATLLRSRRQLRLHIDAPASVGHSTLASASGATEIRTPTLFVGNNSLQLSRVGIAPVDALAAGHGQLAAVVVKPIGTASLFWLLLRGIIGRLGDADNVDTFSFRKLSVTPKGRRRIKVATDGETRWTHTPLVFEVSPLPLWLMVPQEADRVAVE